MKFSAVPGAFGACPARHAVTPLVVRLGTFGRVQDDKGVATEVSGSVSLRVLQLSYSSGQFLCLLGLLYVDTMMPTTVLQQREGISTASPWGGEPMQAPQSIHSLIRVGTCGRDVWVTTSRQGTCGPHVHADRGVNTQHVM